MALPVTTQIILGLAIAGPAAYMVTTSGTEGVLECDPGTGGTRCTDTSGTIAELCNNLDGFLELRLAALLHKPRVGPKALPAAQALALATRGGAAALGLGDTIGALTVGRRGDVIAVDVTGPHVVPVEHPLSALVYAVRASDVRHVAVDGALVVRDRTLLTLDLAAVTRAATAAARQVFARV